MLCCATNDPLRRSRQRDELRAKYALVKRAEDARAGWEDVYSSSLHACMHGVNCTQGRDCQVCARGNNNGADDHSHVCVYEHM